MRGLFLIKVKVQMRQGGPGSERARQHLGNQDTASVGSHIETEAASCFQQPRRLVL